MATTDDLIKYGAVFVLGIVFGDRIRAAIPNVFPAGRMNTPTTGIPYQMSIYQER